MEFIIRQTVDLARENPVLHYAQPLEYGDAGAHRWMVTINKDGAQADLGAMSAKCYVTRAASDAERAQGVTSVMVAQNAEIDAKAGTVSCVFKAACYGGVGAVSAIMRLSDASGATVTSAKLTARLDRNTSDTVCDPEGLVLSLDELLAQIDAMEAATAAAKTATTNANTATGKANTATTNANNAANNAKTQAEAAKSAAAAANAAAKSWGDSTAANSEKLGGKAPTDYLQTSDTVEILPSATYALGATLPFTEPPDNFEGLQGRVDYTTAVFAQGSGGSASRRYILTGIESTSNSTTAGIRIVQVGLVGTYNGNDFKVERITSATIDSGNTVLDTTLNSVQIGPVYGKKFI